MSLSQQILPFDSIKNSEIGIIRLENPVTLDHEQLIKYFTKVPDVTIIDEKNGKGKMILLENNILFHLRSGNEKQISTFKSEAPFHILAAEINRIPPQYHTLKQQLINLYNQLGTIKSQEQFLQKKENDFLKKKEFDLTAIEKQFASFPQKTLTEKPTTTQLKEAESSGRLIVVPERGYAVVEVDSSDKYVGTTDLTACIGIVAINRKGGLVGVAHLDGGTVLTYETSLTQMIKDLQGPENDPITFYMLGGHTLSLPNMPQMEYLSKTLAKSIFDFTQQFQNVQVAEVNLFSGEVSEFLVKINENEHSILGVDPNDVSILQANSKKFSEKQFFYPGENAVSHSELTLMTPPIPDRNLMQTPIKDLNNMELDQLRSDLAPLSDKEKVNIAPNSKLANLTQLLASNHECKACKENMTSILNAVLAEEMNRLKDNSHFLFKSNIRESNVLKAILALPSNIQAQLDSTLMKDAKKYSQNIFQRTFHKEPEEAKYSFSKK